MNARSVCLVMLLCMSSTPDLSAADPADTVDYLTQIKPLLTTKCYSCHGVLKQEAGLRLDTRQLMTAGGDSGAVFTAGDAAGSLLLERVTADEDYRMPPAEDGAALKPDEIELLRRWVNQGAIAPDEEAQQSPTDHWAFQPIRRPHLGQKDTAANPIDILLAAKRKELGLKTQPPAERSVLIRRLYLDLIGLPPTLEQLRDDRPRQVIVDELLNSPHHGERWGRHWMDVWRYSDWYGLGAQLRNSQKHIWRWRDWIVRSLNADKGYDRMIQEMLAGDELAPGDPDVVAGTGFLARNYYLFNRTTWLDSTIEHTGKAFLGLTLNCAKCHDHKYDPLSQVDYYNFRSIFEPHQVRLDPVPGVMDFEKDGLPRVFDDHPDAETWLHVRGDPSNLDRETKIVPQVPAIFADFQPEVKPVDLPAVAYAPGTRPYVQQDHLKAAESAVKEAEQALSAAQQRLAAMPEESATSETKNSEPERFSFADDFESPNAEVWEIVGSGWKFQDGALHQTTASRDAEFIRLRQPLPRDFDLTCRYTTTGGTTYKSVTFRFDESSDRGYANFVYTSAHEPGPKVQAAYTRDGSQTYPPEGRAARPIKVGEPLTLRFAVRDRLVNVWLNDKFAVAYQFPDRQPAGRLSLSGFDATVAFDSISITSLAADVELKPVASGGTGSPPTAAAAVELATAGLAAARARLQSVRAVIAADNARHGTADSGAAKELADTAALLQAKAMLAEAEHERLAAGTDKKKIDAAANKAKTAQQKLAAAEEGNGTYVGIRASRKALEGPADKESEHPIAYVRTSTGRRLSLAKWITSPENPLTARVAVNQVWMRHFGEPLVESVFDFGLRAKKPRHAELLDFLAAEFMDSGFSFRHLHRLIVNSDAYALSSSTLNADPETIGKDPNNRDYWRMNTRRMESQIVRDSLLQLAGQLDPTVGGPSLDVGPNSRRRSLYFKHSRDDQDKFLTMFDDADLLQCYRRSESIVPQQALALANSELAMKMSATIADRISESLPSSDPGEFVRVAFETLLGRAATEAEHAECVAFCDQLQALLQDDTTVPATDTERRVRTRLIHSLLNHNDFISIR
ncbi:MAG: DUF1553 domain-containing protein [Fuerstiella sp.]